MSPGWEKALDATLGAFYIVQFETSRRNVVDYAVVLVVRDREIEHTVRVYDGAHGINELHRYTRSGGKQPAEVFHSGTLGDGMRDAIRQVASSYEAMIESWRSS